jgi:hypothetical protein
MHNLIVRRMDAFERIAQFAVDHPVTPASPAITTLLTDLAGIVTAIGGHADDQEIGRGQVSGGAAIRKLKAELLLSQMRSVNKMVRALNPETYPGAREKFRMPDGGGYRTLIARAQAFLDAISEVKAVLIDRGLPADFDEQLLGARADLVTASADKDSGIATQVGGTAGMLDKSRAGMRILRELDSILSYKYRDDAAMLAGWKSACHVERDTRKASAASSGTPPAPAPTAPPPAA